MYVRGFSIPKHNSAVAVYYYFEDITHPPPIVPRILVE